MNYKTKKVLIVSSSGLIAATAAIAGLSIYFSTPAVVRIPEKDLYLIRLNSKPDASGYKYDVSYSSGPNSSLSITSLVTNELIHMKSEGKLIIESQPGGPDKITPSYQSFEFGLADAAVAVLQNKNNPNDKIELVFDSDEADFPVVPANNQETVLVKNSTNKHSINNQDIFLNLLATGAITKNVSAVENLNKTDINKNGDYILVKLGFTVRENVPWVDHNGQPTKYMLQAEDIWYSFMRSKLFDRDFRRSNGGSKKLDDHFIETTKTATLFQDNGRFTNEYLFGFFDLDVTKLYERESAIQKVSVNGKSREMFTFSALNEKVATNGFLSAVQKLLSNSLLFSAAPSAFIKELAKNDQLNKNLGKNKDLEISGKAREFGTYTYGQTRKDVLYASPYVPVSAIENREVFNYNPHFANQAVVAEIEGQIKKTDPNTKRPIRPVKQIIFEYSGGIDTSTFNSQLLSSYLKGNVSQIAYADLTIDQRMKLFGNDQGSLEEIEERALFNGLQYTKVNNITTFVQRTLVQSNPTNDVKTVDAYGFNDLYSQIVFGMDRNGLKAGTSTTTENFFVGDGFEFRLLIQAAINWDAYVKQGYQNQRVFWINGAAQHAQFSSAAPQKPIEFYEEVNTLEFIDRINPNNKKLVQITPKEMQEHTVQNSNNDIESLKSPKFAQIQQNLKNLLDKIYAEKNWQPEQKIEWEIVYGWGDADIVRTTIMQKIVDIISSLDPRLKPKLIIPKTLEEMINKIASNTGVSDFNGWGYDYEGIGSYIAAFASGIGVSLMNAFDIFSQAQPPAARPELFNWFPQFRKLARFVKEEVKAELDQLKKEIQTTSTYDEQEFNKLYVDQWSKLTNTDNQEIDEFFKKRSNGKYKITTHLAKLFRKYEDYEDPMNNNQKMSAENWVNLIREFNSLRGVSMDLDNSISDPNINNLSLFLREYIVPASHQGILFLQDFRIQDLKTK